jgi:hypothetical protein
VRDGGSRPLLPYKDQRAAVVRDFEHTYLVCLMAQAAGNVLDAANVVPSWWEILLANVPPTGLVLTQLRAGQVNENRDRRALVELVWLDDALAILAARNAVRGFRSKPRRDVWNRVCEIYDVDEIAAVVRERLKARPVRRSARSHG